MALRLALNTTAPQAHTYCQMPTRQFLDSTQLLGTSNSQPQYIAGSFQAIYSLGAHTPLGWQCSCLPWQATWLLIQQDQQEDQQDTCLRGGCSHLGKAALSQPQRTHKTFQNRTWHEWASDCHECHASQLDHVHVSPTVLPFLLLQAKM